MAKISVIIPAYNAEKTIERCLDSILQQNCTDYEAIVIDDGSTDRTYDICERFASQTSRIRVEHKSNGGVSSARNMGLNLATGEWITFLDSDDAILEDSIGTIVAEISRIPYTEPCLIMSNVIIRNPHDPGHIVYTKPVNSIEQMYHEGLWGSVWNKAFQAKVIKENGIQFDESLRFSEDCLFVATYSSLVKHFLFVDKACYIQYEPESYFEKYHSHQFFSEKLTFYKKLKSVNIECSQVQVDGLFMSLVRDSSNQSWKERFSNILFFKTAVGADVRYVLGKWKFAIRNLTNCSSDTIWKLTIGCYEFFHLR